MSRGIVLDVVAVLVAAMLVLAVSGQSGGGLTITRELPRQACSKFSREFSLPSMHFVVNGTRVLANPKTVDGTLVDDSTTLVLQFQNISEQIRYPRYDCLPYSDLLLQWVSLDACTCELSTVYEELDGHKTEGVALQFSQCQGDQYQYVNQTTFVGTLTFTTSNVTYIDTYNTTVPGSSLPSFTYTHYSNGLKVGVRLQNWTYVNGVVGDQYLSLLSYTGLKTSRDVSMLVTTDDMRSVAALDFRENRKVQLITESGIIFDGAPGLKPVTTPLLRNFTFPPTSDYWYYFRTPSDFCAPVNESHKLTNWKDIFYDPSIVGLFSVSPPPSADPSSPTAKSSKNVTVAVVVSIVCVLVVVIAVALVFTFVPAARHLIRPFTKRTDRASKLQSESTERRHTDWQAAQKPREPAQ